jgi:hypothetical protein
MQNGLLASKGSCWRIGKGNSIKVWEDNWVPSQNGFKVLTQNGDNSTVFLVRDLLEGGPVNWNSNLIESILFSFMLMEQLPNKFLLSWYRTHVSADMFQHRHTPTLIITLNYVIFFIFLLVSTCKCHCCIRHRNL